METQTLYTLIGYVGSALVVTSLAMRSIIRLRLIGLAGAITFVAYGYLINAWPIVWTNVVIVLIHSHFLRQIRQPGEYFKILEVRTDSRYLLYFLDHFAEDIEAVWPGFDYHPEPNVLTLFVLRDLVPAGLIVAKALNEDTLRLELDYAIPGYRDFKIGRFLYPGGALQERGYRRVVARPPGQRAREYLTRVGFRPVAGAGDGDWQLGLAASVPARDS